METISQEVPLFGSGTDKDPYKIKFIENLRGIEIVCQESNNPESLYFQLGRDLDFLNRNHYFCQKNNYYMPDESLYIESPDFVGHFDYNGFMINKSDKELIKKMYLG